MNWQERLDKAEERGTFAAGEPTLAANWTTCAVGECHPDVGRGLEYDRYAVTPEEWERLMTWREKYPRLYALGQEFYNAVRLDNVPEARRLYERIKGTSIGTDMPDRTRRVEPDVIVVPPIPVPAPAPAQPVVVTEPEREKVPA